MLSSISGYSLTSEKSRKLPGEGRTWALPSTLTAVFSPEGEAPILLPYQFQMEEIESFRYRCRVSLTRVGRRVVEEWAVTQGLCPIAEHPGGCVTVYPQDAMRSVTKQAIREARLKEIKEELLHSEKLKVRWS